MKWTLLFLVVLLFLWSIRENFDNYADALRDVGQSTGYTDTEHPDAPHTGVGTAGSSGSGSSGSGSSGSGSSGSGSGSGSGSSGSGSGATNTTGGSTLTPQPNSGDKKNKLFGPAFVGMGDSSGLAGLAGSTREYPTLIGPSPKESTMVEGAGVISQPNSVNKIGLPSSKHTGSDEDAKYFGSSRVPGDKDLFPNPYQEFTPSSGSSKTEPVPFLSDFSAFQK